MYESGQVEMAQVFDRSWKNEKDETRNTRFRVDAATLAEVRAALGPVAQLQLPFHCKTYYPAQRRSWTLNFSSGGKPVTMTPPRLCEGPPPEATRLVDALRKVMESAPKPPEPAPVQPKED